MGWELAEGQDDHELHDLPFPAFVELYPRPEPLGDALMVLLERAKPIVTPLSPGRLNP